MQDNGSLHGKRQLWLEGMQQKLEANNTFNFKPIRVCFINVYTYPNHKPTPYNNAKTVIFKVNKTLLLEHYLLILLHKLLVKLVKLQAIF